MSECLNELKFVLFVLFFMNFIIYLHLSITVYLSSGSYISCHHQMLVGDRSPPSKCDVSSMVTSGELWTQTWGTLRSSTWSHQVHNIYAETRNCHVLFCHNTKDFSQFLFVMHCKTLMSNSWLQSHQLINFSDSNSAEGLLCSFKWATKGYCPNVFTACGKWKPQTTVYGNFQHHFSFKMNITY